MKQMFVLILLVTLAVAGIVFYSHRQQAQQHVQKIADAVVTKTQEYAKETGESINNVVSEVGNDAKKTEK